MKKIHFMGIGGIGLSGLARFSQSLGHEISGSDLKSNYVIKQLLSEGMEIKIPQNVQNIQNQNIVVYSAAIKNDNIELLEARRKGLKVLSRRGFLPFLLNQREVYAVAGAHGKSTTSAILGAILQDANVIIGANSKEFDSNVRIRPSRKVVFEADESDASFLDTNPYCAIVTNAEPEHMEFYNYDKGAFFKAYETFIKKAKTRVLNKEDDFLKTLDVETIWLEPSCDIKNVHFDLVNNEPHTFFDLKDLGSFCVWGLGYHTAVDAALAILGALNELPLEQIRQNIRLFKGIAKRFDVLCAKDDFVLIDDYAHHPTEVKATMCALKTYASLKKIEKIVCIWQPHKYSRTLSNIKEFAQSFQGCENLIILPVYAAGESFVDIDFNQFFGQYKPIFADSVFQENETLFVMKNGKVIKHIKEFMVVGLGAGDITYQLRGMI